LKERKNGGNSMPNPEARAQARTISNAMTQLHRENYGRGATSVRTVVQDDYVITFLEDMYTQLERTLIDAGLPGPVKEARLAFQQAMKSAFVAMVEEATGRKVRAFLSQTATDPDISVEVFVLEPPVGEQMSVGGAVG
jgi:uncharacterized protein YbcI